MSYTYDQINIGDTSSFSKTLSESDVYQFAGITGDLNPMDINEVAASQTPFGGRIVHGCLVDSLISTVLGMQYPGPGTIFMEKSVKYLAPVKIGDTVTARVEVTEKLPKGTVVLKADYTNQDGTPVAEGEVRVKAPRN